MQSDHAPSEDEMDFLEILPENQANQVREILSATDLPEVEKKDIVCLMIKNDLALKLFKEWWSKKKPTIAEEDFLKLLKPTLRRIAESLLASNDLKGLNDLMAAPSARDSQSIFEQWKCQIKRHSGSCSSASAEDSESVKQSPISLLQSHPHQHAVYSSWAEIPIEAAEHLLGLNQEDPAYLYWSLGCRVETATGSYNQPARYRVSGPDMDSIEKCLLETVSYLGRLQRTEEVLGAAIVKGLQSLPESAQIELQRKHKFCISNAVLGLKTTSNKVIGLKTTSVVIKAWSPLEMISAKHEIMKILEMTTTRQSSPPPSYPGLRENVNYHHNTTHFPHKPETVVADSSSDVEEVCQPHNADESVVYDINWSRPGPDISKYPDCMNILVLGETGVGKSTFINGLINYFNYESMEDALQNEVQILIKSSFTLTDNNYEPVKITSLPTIVDEQRSQENTKENEDTTEDAGSATQDPKSYRFSFGTAENQKFVRIIDTPGIGDTRGVDKDKTNFQNILQFISQFPEIHAVCILIKPNSSRLTLAFRFCIDELLVHLHRSASANLLFCFTNTRATLYKPGDSLPTLRAHLKTLKKRTNIDIELNKDTLFSFDNESFRFLCALKEGFPFTNSEKKDFENSWTNSVEETQRLFDRICQLPVHKVHDTLSLNNARNVILSLTRPLGEVSKVLMLNKKLIEDKMNEVRIIAQTEGDLQGKLCVDQVIMNAQEVDKPQTVCTAQKCVDHQRFSPNSSELQTVYKQVCHEDCHVDGIQAEVCPNPKLQKCWALSSNIEKCRICGCNWQTHMHYRYKLVSKMVKVEDPTVKASLESNGDIMLAAQVWMEEKQKKVEELTRESEKIAEYCVEFASFLAKHSILPYNDSYGQYLEHLIVEEEGKLTAGGSRKLLEQLMTYKAEYTEQVNTLSEHMNNNSSKKANCPDDIDLMVKELLTMKNCGAVLEAVKNMEMLCVQKHPPKEPTIETKAWAKEQSSHHRHGGVYQRTITKAKDTFNYYVRGKKS